MRYLSLVFIGLVLFSGIASAEEKLVPYQGEMRFIFKNLPSFYDYPDYESYPVPEPPKNLADDVDLSSHRGAENFRTVILEGFNEGPKYAGKYAVAMHGCGTSCQVYWIINVETGNVVANVTAGSGAAYKIDSRLFIINPPSDPMNVGGEYGFPATEHPIDFYLIGDNEEFKLIKRLDVRGMFPDVQKIKEN